MSLRRRRKEGQSWVSVTNLNRKGPCHQWYWVWGKKRDLVMGKPAGINLPKGEINLERKLIERETQEKYSDVTDTVYPEWLNHKE